MKVAIAGLAVLGAAVIAWIAWGPLLHWLWAFAPSSASWYPAWKLLCLILIAWGGGIALPLCLIAGAFYALIVN